MCCCSLPKFSLKRLLVVLLFSASAAAAGLPPAALAEDELFVPDSLLELSQSFGQSTGSPLAVPDMQISGNEVQNPQQNEAPSSPFELEILQDGKQIKVTLSLSPGAYIYQDSLKFEAADLKIASPILPPAQEHQDIQGVHAVYFDRLELLIPIISCTKGATFSLTYQGCDAAGICYPPMTQVLHLEQAVKPETLQTVQTETAVETSLGTTEHKDTAVSTSAEHTITALSSAAVSSPSQDSEVLAALQDNFLLGLLLCFALGILLDLTPCVLPMLPILSAMMSGSAQASKAQIIKQNTGYAAGLCLTYTLLGLLFSLLGASLQGILQHPYFVTAIALVLVICALACVDLIKLPLPQRFNAALQNFAGSRAQGRFSSALILGIVSALVASPCTSAPLAGALLYVMQTGSLTKGAAAFFCIGLGMAAPLFVIGLFGSSLIKKAGRFTESIKKVLALLLVLAAIYLTRNLMSADSFAIALALTVGLGVFYIGFAPAKRHLLAKQYLPMVLLCLVSLALLQNVYSAFAPADSKQSEQVSVFSSIYSLKELEQYQAGTVLLDFTAAWCTNCKAMESQVFATAEFAALARQHQLTLLQFDITNVDEPEVHTMLQHFKIFGVPYLVLIKEGELVGSTAGYQNLADLQTFIEDRLAQ